MEYIAVVFTNRQRTAVILNNGFSLGARAGH